MKKLIPAVVMLLVSAVVLSTASYAWFTTSQSVDASGMNVTAEAPTSVLISGFVGEDVNDKDDWSQFTSFVVFPTLENRISAASSFDGKNFYEPRQCDDIHGSIKYGSDITYYTEAEAANGYYVDYLIKLENTSAAKDVQIFVEDLSFANASAINGAVRVAIINEEGEAFVFNPSQKSGNTTTWVNVLDKDGNKTLANGPLNYKNGEGNNDDYTFNEGTFAAAAAGASKTYCVWGDMNEKDNNQVIGTLPAYEANAYDESVGEDGTIVTTQNPEYTENVEQFTIRVWFEGQDSACITENAGLAAGFSITFGLIEVDNP